MTTYTLSEARNLTDAALEAAHEAAQERKAEIVAARKAYVAAALAQIGKTEDTAANREYSRINEAADEKYDDEYRAVYYNLHVAREERQELRCREAAANWKSATPKRCPKCGHIVTANGRCDECDDWDN